MSNICNQLANIRALLTAGSTVEALTALAEAEKTAAEGPEIAIYMEGGLIQEVRRNNDAPFTLRVHDHDTECSTDDICAIVWGQHNVEHATITTHTLDTVELIDNPGYWDSLRNPVFVDLDDEDSDIEA